MDNFLHLDPLIENNLKYLNIDHFYSDFLKKSREEHIKYNLGLGEIDNIKFPIKYTELYKKFVNETNFLEKITKYGGSSGIEKIVTLFAEEVKITTGLSTIDKDSIVFFNGAHEAISNAIYTVISPFGSKQNKKQYVLTSFPSYPYLSIIINSKAGVITFQAFSSEDYIEKIEILANDKVNAILVNIPHNPMGYIFNSEQINKLNKIAEKVNSFIIVDMVYSSLNKNEKNNELLSLFDPERTIFCDSFSKKFGLPGLRLGYSFSQNKQITASLRTVKSNYSLLPSALQQLFAGYILENFNDYSTIIRNEILTRRMLFNQYFNPRRELGLTTYEESENLLYQCLDLSKYCKETKYKINKIANLCEINFGIKLTPGNVMMPNGRIPFHPFFGNNKILEEQFLCFEMEKNNENFLRLSFGIENDMKSIAEQLNNALTNILLKH